MKYKVLKDMPRAKVGDILELEEKNEYSWTSRPYLKLTETGISTFVITEPLIEPAIKEGFIEELKEDRRWKPERNHFYFRVLGDGTITQAYNDSYVDEEMIAYNNAFKSVTTAQKVAEAHRLFYEYLHTVPGSPQQNIKNRFEQAHSIARKAVLEDDGTTS